MTEEQIVELAKRLSVNVPCTVAFLTQEIRAALAPKPEKPKSE